MACHCFDFCTGAITCVELPTDPSEQGCINACHARNLGYFISRPTWNNAYATCEADMTVQSVVDWPGVPVLPWMTEGVLWQEAPDPGIPFVSMCVPSWFDVSAYSFVFSNLGRKTQVYVPTMFNTGERCSTFGLDCCQGDSVGNVAILGYQFPSWVIPTGGCYEHHQTDAHCGERPCCRQASMEWPPYPPRSGLPLGMGAYCDLSTKDDCLRRGFWPTTHRNAFSCWFPHTCNPGVEACGDVPVVFQCATRNFAPSVRLVEHGGSATEQDIEPVSMLTMDSRADTPHACRYEYAGLRSKRVDNSDDSVFWNCGNGQLGLNDNPEYNDCAIVYDDNGDAMITCGYTDHATQN